MKSKRWLWALAVLPVAGLPLIAEESRPEAPVAPAEAAGATPTPEAPEPATRQQEPADERISADNSLSYPVDI